MMNIEKFLDMQGQTKYFAFISTNELACGHLFCTPQGTRHKRGAAKRQFYWNKSHMMGFSSLISTQRLVRTLRIPSSNGLEVAHGNR